MRLFWPECIARFELPVAWNEIDGRRCWLLADYVNRVSLLDPLPRLSPVASKPVCTGNLVRVDDVVESLSWRNDRAALFLSRRLGLSI